MDGNEPIVPLETARGMDYSGLTTRTDCAVTLNASLGSSAPYLLIVGNQPIGPFEEAQDAEHARAVVEALIAKHDAALASVSQERDEALARVEESEAELAAYEGTVSAREHIAELEAELAPLRKTDELARALEPATFAGCYSVNEHYQALAAHLATYEPRADA